MEKLGVTYKAPAEIHKEIQEIDRKCQERGYILKPEAERLRKISHKYQVCAECGRSLSEAKTWRTMYGVGYQNKDVEIGLVPTCFECEFRSMFFDPEVNIDLAELLNHKG